eukprot:COSAG02_NODE_44495_length_365_cov_1.928571_1_plen_77_part_10
MTAKGVPIDGKRSPHCYPQEESPFSLKEESHWPPWDSVLNGVPRRWSLPISPAAAIIYESIHSGALNGSVDSWSACW